MYSKATLFEAELGDLADAAKALAHPARLSILQVLSARGTCICGDIVEQLPLAQASVSRHLKVLKEAGFIQGEIDGPRSCYCLDAQALSTFRSQLIKYVDCLQEESKGSCC